MAQGTLSAGLSAVQTTDYSLTVGTSAVQVWSTNPFAGKTAHYMRIYNLSSTATLWCSRSGVATANAPGSFPIAPLSYELWVMPGPIPTNPLSVVSSAASTPVTIEVG